jgi:2,4-dienoyl-CoA reductase-like NADH-dependent reductase (Old Yellow Enzyme family)/thioredoxin reductase
MKYPNLLSPRRIGKCEIKNRFVVTAMVANLNPDDGLASERYIKYHEEKARGGFGLIITENYRINEHCGGYPYIASIYGERHIPSHKAFTDVIHQYGAKVFCQIYHAGRESNSRVNGGVQPVAPSPIPCPANKEVPRELTAGDIRAIVAEFANAAKNAKAAGFDGVEVHCAHGYLLHEFIYSNTNKRIDEYGGNYSNRTRIIREVLDAVRAAVGPDFPMIVRISAADHIEGGRVMFETRQFCRDLEAWGADAINVSVSMYGSPMKESGIASFFANHGNYVKYAAEVKSLVGIPVMAVGRLQEPTMCEDILKSGMADFIAMGRESLADPHLPEKIASGREDDVRHCIGCIQGCFLSTVMGIPINCLVNPELGYEFETDWTRTAAPKNVLVAGGGIAGMEAARVAAMKGHKVQLYEASDTLGGQFLAASYPPCKGDFSTLPAWQLRQLKQLGVEIHLNTPVTPELVKAVKPDKVILATGAVPVMPKIEGIDRPNVYAAVNVLLGRRSPGNKVVVVGGGMIGTETAAFLGQQCQSDVTVVEALGAIGRDMIPGILGDYKEILARYNVRILTDTKIHYVVEEGAVVQAQDGTLTLIPCDGIVMSIGTKGYNPLEKELKGICETVVVGDAAEPRKAIAAMRDAFVAGMNV